MRCIGLAVASLLSLMAAGVEAGDFVDDVRHDFAMGLFPRQVATNLQVRNTLPLCFTCSCFFSADQLN
jgi:hypothetical protein